MGLTAHSSDDQLEQYAQGRLLKAEVERLEHHLLACDECRGKVDAFDDFSAGMREALAGSGAKAENRFAAPFAEWLAAAMRRPAVSMALAFVLLIGVIGVFSPGKTKFAETAALQLTAVRGEMPTTEPTRELDLTLTDGPREGGPFRVEIVNAIGGAVWQGLAVSTPAGVRVDVKQRLGQGDYFVRLDSASGAVLHEYGFRVRN